MLPQRVMRDGLEGLVLKAVDGIYEPGKRHWLKLKRYVGVGLLGVRCGWSTLAVCLCRDYLNQGAMADTADLVVLGVWRDG